MSLLIPAAGSTPKTFLINSNRVPLPISLVASATSFRIRGILLILPCASSADMPSSESAFLAAPVGAASLSTILFNVVPAILP